MELSVVPSVSPIHPLMPRERPLEPLLDRAATLTRAAHVLGTQAGRVAESLRPLLRAMNSYYTNRIEGQHTRPSDIARALEQEFDADRAQARKQRLAVAHIEAEEALEATVALDALYTPAFVSSIHAAMFSRLPARERVSDTGERVVPGGFRAVVVTAGHHVAPPPDQVQPLLATWGEGYRKLAGLEHKVVGAVCAHHRCCGSIPSSTAMGAPHACTPIWRCMPSSSPTACGRRSGGWPETSSATTPDSTTLT